MANVRVLLVDDAEDFLEPVRFWLESKGYLVMTANNGQEALDAIKRHAPNIVFLDINMPGMNGLEALKRIRSLYGNLPVVMVTAAYQNEQYFAEANKLGISGFFPKSNSLPDLTRMIEMTLRAHGKIKAAEGEQGAGGAAASAA
jgi:CheY-like chemotaxis protein